MSSAPAPNLGLILLVEDDPAVREIVTMTLRREGYQVETAASGDEALVQWRHSKPDLILLDIMLPGKDGIDVCGLIRREDQVPIVMLTARADPIDVVVGLEAGADDYVTKPFETRVLLARIKAVRRRSAHDVQSSRLTFGDLSVDLPAMEVTKGGAQVSLSHTEFRLLTVLAQRPGQVFTRTMLLELVWDYAYLGDSRLVDVCVQRLRAKVESDPTRPALIQTVRGAGYKLVPPPLPP